MVFFKTINHFTVAQLNAGHVNIDRTLNPSPFRIGHTPPVLERTRYQGIGRDGAYGFVPVLDGDGVQDVCFVTDAGLLYAVAGDGQPLAGYPKTMVSGSISGVAVGDIDGDGLFELVAATWDGWVYAWDTPAQANPELADWPMRGVDARNTGVFGADDQTTAVGELNPTPRFGLRILGNPVTARVEFLIEGDAAAATLEIFDVNGRRVDELSVDGRQRLLWHPDSTLPAGVYLARLTGGRNTETAKFVIVR